MLERGQGSHAWDADGNEYIDFMMSFGALIQGHAHPTLVKAVCEAMAEGPHFAAATSAEVEAAERFCRMVPIGRGGALHQQRQRVDHARFAAGPRPYRPS